MTLELWSAVWSMVTKRKEEGRDGRRHRHGSFPQMSLEGMLIISLTKEASVRGVLFEDKVQEELGIKLRYTPNRLKLLLSRCVHMQQVYIGDSLSFSFSFHIHVQFIYLSIVSLFTAFCFLG